MAREVSSAAKAGAIACVLAVLAPGLALAAASHPHAGVPAEWLPLASALGGGAIGAGGKWFFDQWSDSLKARRLFAEKIADSVVKLSQEHYWRLATVSGVLARVLQLTVQERVLHLVLPWDTRADLDAKLRTLSNEAAKRTFPHFVHLISSFQTFQFHGSNTYLLTRHAAGEDCKRLYNAFIDSLSDELRGQLAELHAANVNLAGKFEPPDRKRVSEVEPADLTLEIITKTFGKQYKMWKLWLDERPDSVQRAADTLRAYSELLTLELADLYQAWLRRDPTGAQDRWDVLSAASRGALQRVRGVSTLYQPLGGGLTGSPLSAPPAARAPGAASAEMRQNLREPDPPKKDSPLAASQ